MAANRFVSAVLSLFVLLTGCSGDATCRAIGGRSEITATLLLGSQRPNNRVVDDATWADFLRDEITPRFPDGLTVFSTRGQWREPESGRIASEPARVVIIVTPDDSALGDKLRAVASAYKARFEQRSVGILLNATCAAF